MENITNATGHHENESHEIHGVEVVGWNFHYVAEPLVVVIFIVVAMFLKLGFHYASFLSSIIPESCLLIIAGTIFGAILNAAGLVDSFQLVPRTFLLFLLPPIVLDSAYSLNDRVFAEHFGTILIYAVIGTILNFILLGPTLYGLSAGGAMGNLEITIVECLLFASFIVAVDPVAVLAIFQEIGVNNVLYFLVFGESLLNDAVTVVLSNTMKTFEVLEEKESIPAKEVLIGIASFFTVSLGGLCIGVLFGVLTALTTRLTDHVRVVEPLALIVLAYASYLCAELFHWSGIISMIGCGIVQAQYAFHNISRKSKTTVNYFVKMLSACNDTIIFLFLGIELVATEHMWHAGFILWTLFFILVYRLIVTFALTFLVNKANPLHRINYEEQFIMWYGGLRGAVCFALCETIRDEFPHKNMFLTTTLIVIIFTVFIQGITIKPLVKLCQIRRKDEDESKSLFEELNCRVTDHLMAGLEVVIKHKGSNYLRSFVIYIDDTYLKKWFTKDQRTTDEQILEEYANILLMDYEQELKEAIMKQPVAKSKFYGELEPSPQPSKRLTHGSALHDPNNSQFDEKLGGAVLRRRAMASQKGSQRRSIADIITGRRTLNLEDPTVGDIKHLLHQSTLSEQQRHQKYDRNLMRDDQRDLEYFLHEKRLRRQRLQRVASQSIASSRLGTPALDPKAISLHTVDESQDEDRCDQQPSPLSKKYLKHDTKGERHLRRQDANSEEYEMEKRNNNKLK